jgi:hypothetical protein
MPRPIRLFSASQAARLLGRSFWSIHHAIRSGWIRPPTYIIDKKAIFTEADIDAARAALDAHPKRGRPRKNKAREGVPA